MLLWLPKAGAVAINEPIISNNTNAGESFSTNYTANAPGPVALTYKATLTYNKNYIMNGPSTPEGAGVAGIFTLNVSTSGNASVASLSLTNAGKSSTASVSVSGNAAAFTLNGTWSDVTSGWFAGEYGSSLSYEGTYSSNANSPFSGSATVTETSSTAPVAGSCSLEAASSGGTVTELYPQSDTCTMTYTGTFTFYAPVAGTYAITVTSPSTYNDQTLFYNSSYAGLMHQMESDSASLTVQLPAPSVPALPTGSITATRTGGANGVSLQWSITPPTP